MNTKSISSELDDVLAHIERRMRQKAEEQSHLQGSKEPDTAKVIKLPVWPDAVRAVPNGFLRSALFGAIKKGLRPYLERAEIHAQDGIQIRYTGARLDQGDLDVWETILHIIRDQDLGSECRVNAYQILKIWGKTDTGKNRDTLDRRLSRMKATALDISIGKYSYEGSLIDEVYREKESKEYVIFLNPKLKVLFGSDQFTQVQWDVRKRLDGQPLAQWLHNFFASHIQPFPIKVETVHKLCGSEAERIDHFKEKLKKALIALQKASQENGQKFDFYFKKNLLFIEKTASQSQQKHLQKHKK